MDRLAYWHPVLPGRDLPRDRAVAVKLAGRSIALFRGSDGRVGAVADQCAHRRMKLSVGMVRQEKLVCAYHGWAFDRDGRGESPSAPRLQACVTSYECAEASGAIWVKARDSSHALSVPAMDGWDFVGVVSNKFPAPLQLVIDNFGELEHTVTTHKQFGFDLAQADQATIEMATTEESITVRCHGPAKMPPLDTRLGVGIRRGDWFHANYTFRFDPPRSSVTHWWTDSRAARERMFKYHVVHYFVPENEKVTTMLTFCFLQIHWPLLRRLGQQIGWFFRRRAWQGVEEDVSLLRNLADYSSNLDGMKLGRFDSILGLTRERLGRIYDGVANGAA
jgi:phenylpropionate dioxygenase-like ring-hydroxylating dioxygenase large terminal subunit